MLLLSSGAQKSLMPVYEIKNMLHEIYHENLVTHILINMPEMNCERESHAD